MIRVVLVEDQLLLREALAYMLQQDDEIDVVGEADHGYQAIELCQQLLPDVVLMDIHMPKMNGVLATRKIKEQFPSVKIIMLTTFEAEKDIVESFVNFADGYIVKDIKPEHLLLAVKSVVNQLYVMHKSVYDVLLEKFIFRKDNQLTKTRAINRYALTESDLKIIELIVEGNSNKQIAAHLNFSEGTIKNKISQLLSKVDVKDRTQLVVFAIKSNLI